MNFMFYMVKMIKCGNLIRKSYGFNWIVDILKNVDLDALSKSFEGLQKILDLSVPLLLKNNQSHKIGSGMMINE